VISADARAAWRFYRDLRTWRARETTGHVWVRIDLTPGRAVTVQPRRLVEGNSAARVTRWSGLDRKRDAA
jgi:hypothetical protein